MERKKNTRLVIYAVIIFILVTLVILRTVISQQEQTKSDAAANNTSPSISLNKVEGTLLPQIPDFPLYPGVEIDYSYEKRDGNKVGYEVELKTPDTATVIANWYLQALPAAGWTITRTPESIATITPPGPPTDIEFMIIAEKDGREAIFIIENEGGSPESEIYAEFPLKEQ